MLEQHTFVWILAMCFVMPLSLGAPLTLVALPISRMSAVFLALGKDLKCFFSDLFNTCFWP
jgi:hypothetical protein